MALSWHLLRSFLAVARSGSLSAAAEELGTTQPTVGRQIRALEEEVGGKLFTREARGLRPTPLAARLIPSASAMAEAAHALDLAASGEDQRIEGPVRITASCMVSWAWLPPILARLRAEEPGITLDLEPTDRDSNLTFREADIAVRMHRPRQLALIARHLGDMPLAAFASRDYVARKGVPKGPADLPRHDWVGLDRNPLLVEGFRQAGVEVRREDFATRCDDPLTGWELVRAGCGIGIGQRILGRRDPELVELDLGVPLPVLPVWLTAHESLRRAPRIARVWDALATGLAPLVERPA